MAKNDENICEISKENEEKRLNDIEKIVQNWEEIPEYARGKFDGISRLWGVIEEGRIHELISVSLSSTDREPESRLQAMESVQPGEVVSRPLKFGNPLVRKKLHSLLLAPDSSGRYPYMKVEGSNDCVNWYFLAESKSGYARLRGSGWRTYRVRLLLCEALPAGMLAHLYK